MSRHNKSANRSNRKRTRGTVHAIPRWRPQAPQVQEPQAQPEELGVQPGDYLGPALNGPHRVIERLGSRLLIEDVHGDRWVIKLWRSERSPWLPACRDLHDTKAVPPNTPTKALSVAYTGSQDSV